jgi:hypothetical protein
MAQTGYTPIQLYYSSTATNVPLAANLAGGELAINITDGKLFYKDNANAIQVIGWKVVPATAGGTGQTSYAVGDLIYANTTTTLAKLADVATGNALISGGVGVAPSYGKIGLTTHVSGTLPVANGGTNLTSYTTGDLIYASASGTLASLADVATGNALISGGVGVAPSYGKIGLTTHVSGILPVANGGTNASTASITSFNNITGYTASGATGTTSTNLVFSTSPSLVTPSLGVASATSLATVGTVSTVVPATVTSFSAVCNAGDQSATSLKLSSARTDVFYHIQAFTSGTTEQFRVEANGNTKNTNNSYGALSDIKIKENVIDATPKLADLMQVKVRNYNLIGETTKQIGVVAQELEEIFPGMVDETKDRDVDGEFLGTTTKGVKYSVFVPILIKAIQELKSEFDAYKAQHP